jgi:hypothetical protein
MAKSKADVNDYFNVKLSVDQASFHGDLTILDILTRKLN